MQNRNCFIYYSSISLWISLRKYIFPFCFPNLYIPHCNDDIRAGKGSWGRVDWTPPPAFLSSENRGTGKKDPWKWRSDVGRMGLCPWLNLHCLCPIRAKAGLGCLSLFLLPSPHSFHSMPLFHCIMSPQWCRICRKKEKGGFSLICCIQECYFYVSEWSALVCSHFCL